MSDYTVAAVRELALPELRFGIDPVDSSVRIERALVEQLERQVELPPSADAERDYSFEFYPTEVFHSGTSQWTRDTPRPDLNRVELRVRADATHLAVRVDDARHAEARRGDAGIYRLVRRLDDGRTPVALVDAAVSVVGTLDTLYVPTGTRKLRLSTPEFALLDRYSADVTWLVLSLDTAVRQNRRAALAALKADLDALVACLNHVFEHQARPSAYEAHDTDRLTSSGTGNLAASAWPDVWQTDRPMRTALLVLLDGAPGVYTPPAAGAAERVLVLQTGAETYSVKLERALIARARLTTWASVYDTLTRGTGAPYARLAFATLVLIYNSQEDRQRFPSARLAPLEVTVSQQHDAVLDVDLTLYTRRRESLEMPVRGINSVQQTSGGRVSCDLLVLAYRTTRDAPPPRSISEFLQRRRLISAYDVHVLPEAKFTVALPSGPLSLYSIDNSALAAPRLVFDDSESDSGQSSDDATDLFRFDVGQGPVSRHWYAQAGSADDSSTWQALNARLAQQQHSERATLGMLKDESQHVQDVDWLRVYGKTGALNPALSAVSARTLLVVDEEADSLLPVLVDATAEPRSWPLATPPFTVVHYALRRVRAAITVLPPAPLPERALSEGEDGEPLVDTFGDATSSEYRRDTLAQLEAVRSIALTGVPSTVLGATRDADSLFTAVDDQTRARYDEFYRTGVDGQLAVDAKQQQRSVVRFDAARRQLHTLETLQALTLVEHIKRNPLLYALLDGAPAEWVPIKPFVQRARQALADQASSGGADAQMAFLVLNALSDRLLALEQFGRTHGGNGWPAVDDTLALASVQAVQLAEQFEHVLTPQQYTLMRQWHYPRIAASMLRAYDDVRVDNTLVQRWMSTHAAVAPVTTATTSASAVVALKAAARRARVKTPARPPATQTSSPAQLPPSAPLQPQQTRASQYRQYWQGVRANTRSSGDSIMQQHKVLSSFRLYAEALAAFAENAGDPRVTVDGFAHPLITGLNGQQSTGAVKWSDAQLDKLLALVAWLTQLRMFAKPTPLTALSVVGPWIALRMGSTRFVPPDIASPLSTADIAQLLDKVDTLVLGGGGQSRPPTDRVFQTLQQEVLAGQSAASLFWMRHAAAYSKPSGLPAYSALIDALATELAPAAVFSGDMAKARWNDVWGNGADAPEPMRTRLIDFYCELFFLGKLDTARFVHLLDAVYFGAYVNRTDDMLKKIDALYMDALRDNRNADVYLVAAIADIMFASSSVFVNKLRTQLGAQMVSTGSRLDATRENFVKLAQMARADDTTLRAALTYIGSFEVDEQIKLFEILGTVAATMHEQKLLEPYVDKFLGKVAQYTLLDNATAWLSVATECHRDAQAGVVELRRVLGGPSDAIRADIVAARLPDKITQALFANVDWDAASPDELRTLRSELNASVFFTPEIVAPGNFLMAFSRLVQALDT
jgi:hypothetical protein